MRKVFVFIIFYLLFACTNGPSDAVESAVSSPIETTQIAPQKQFLGESGVQEDIVAVNAMVSSNVHSNNIAASANLVKPLARPSMSDLIKSVPLGLLPEGARPLRYALELTVDPDRERFSGRANITVELDRSTHRLFLHGKNLDVTSVNAHMADGKIVNAVYTQVHPDGVAVVDFQQPLAPGRVQLIFDYSAAFGRLLHGLYKIEEQGVHYAFTQMESVYAREAFPSFDEPAFKTPFDLTLIVQRDHEAIANTPVVSQEDIDGNLKRIRYATSQPMTTYLFAIAVGPLDIVDGGFLPPNSVRKTPLPFRGVAAKGKGDLLEYAMRETGAILTAMETYFDSPYPYAKLDIIAVPDFEAGAMENIGAVTFREKLLLLEDDAPPQQKRAYASVMAHELAHMWFGNLVTMPWWDDIWLNESFATWMSYVAIDEYAPEHKPYVAQTKRTAYAMREDALINARQIREPVLNNDDIVAAFDGITYSKGGAVLSMFEEYVGAAVFRDAVRAHMTKFAHGSATVHDLVASLSEAAEQDLSSAANSFLFQNGIPLVEVALDCKANMASISQSRFLPLGSRGDKARNWVIPMCLKYGKGDETYSRCLLLSEDTQSVEFEQGCPDWLLPNAKFAGYFHWLMPAPQYTTLLEASNQLDERELLSVADSARAGFSSGKLDVGQAWGVIEQLSRSSHQNVARNMMPTIRFISDQLGDNPKLRWVIRGRAGELYKNLEAYRAFDADFLKQLPDNETRIHYSDVASFMAEIAFDQTTRTAALAKARDYLESPEKAKTVSRSTLDTILTVGVQDGGKVFSEQLFDAFKASDNSWFRDTALTALARSRDPKFGEKLRNSALEGVLKRNEIRRLFSSQRQEDVNVGFQWEWLKAHVDELIPLMPARHVASLSRIGESLCNVEYAKDVDAILRPRLRKFPGAERRLDISLEQLEICAETKKVQYPQAQAYFMGGAVRR